MLLVYGTAGLMLAMLLFALTLIGSRNPGSPAWANDFLVANLYVPVMIALGVAGVGSMIKFIVSPDSRSLDVTAMVLTVGIAGVGLLLLKLLRVRQHLAEFTAMQPTGKVITTDRFASGGNGSETPDNPTSGNLAA